jgi:hypothetical protein
MTIECIGMPWRQKVFMMTTGRYWTRRKQEVLIGNLGVR